MTVAAANVADREAVLQLVDDACAFMLGDFAGVVAVDVQRESDGPPITVKPANIYTRAKDYRVGFNRPA